MVGVSVICGIYALLSTISSWVTNLVSKAWLFFVPDQVFRLLKSIYPLSFFFFSQSLTQSSIRFLKQVNNSVCKGLGLFDDHIGSRSNRDSVFT